MKSSTLDCIIVGGGAAGLYCAAQLARTAFFSGKKILIIEGGSRVGNKLALTGSGRCNLTNTEIDLTKYNTDDQFKLESLMNRYGETDTSYYFENVLGVVLEQKGTLVYPATLKSSTVVDALRFYLEDNKVEIDLKEKVTSIAKSEDLFEVKTDADKTHLTKNIVIATGGITYPVTGSTGDVLKLVEGLTDKTCFVPFKPALTSLSSNMVGIKGMAGIKCRGDVKIVGSDGVIRARSEGEILFTKEGGISGICVMDVSDSVVRLFDEGDENVKAVLNLTGKAGGEILQMIYIRRQMYPHRNCSDALSGMLLRNVTDFVMKKMGLKADKMTLRELNDKQLVDLTNLLCAFPIPITGYGDVDKAQVSSGGFKLSKLDDNMQVKYCPGLYIIGEAVNVNGICGGYNLQWAWTSAALAAEGISQNV
ncbi:MAG: aminoacetone oxidase family FAD-binding enzyme [Clostridiales bacterium]|nr:aminoacetone oxidase family FAD-binding enzyme [Clostridiales bacterium]